eukprot:sb/3465374/
MSDLCLLCIENFKGTGSPTFDSLHRNLAGITGKGPPPRSVVGYVHDESFRLDQIIRVFAMDWIYCPIPLSNRSCYEIRQCLELTIEVTSFPDRPLGSSSCLPCLKRTISHCEVCSFWCKLAVSTAELSLDWLLFSWREGEKSSNFTESTIKSVAVNVSNCRHPEGKSVNEPYPDDTAYVIATSGTTGLPKSVAVPNSSIIPNILFFQEQFKITSADTILICSPPTFDPLIIEMSLFLVGGAKDIIQMSPSDIYGQTLSTGIRNSTVVMCTPSLLTMIPRSKLSATISHLRILALGGEKFPSHILPLASPDTQLFDMYGVTEQSVWSILRDVRDEGTSLGLVVPGTEYRINESTGELELGGERRCSINGVNWEGWYRTGDRVENGRIVGRLGRDQMMITD